MNSVPTKKGKQKPVKKPAAGSRKPATGSKTIPFSDPFYDNYTPRSSGGSASYRSPSPQRRGEMLSGATRSVPQNTKKKKGKPPSSRKAAQNASAMRQKRQQQLRQEQIAKTQRRRRKKRKRNYTLYYIILAVFLIVAGVTLSLTVFFNIETIQVTGSSIYTLSDLDGVLDVKPGDNLLRLNTKTLSETVLQNLKKADRVEVKRVFPTTLLIEIEDGVPQTQLYYENKYYTLSQRGRVLDIAEESVPNVPVVIGPKPDGAQIGSYIDLILENEEKDWLKILFKELEESGLNDISVVDISSTISLKLYYQNRIEIKLGSFSELDTKLAMVKAVFDSGDIGIEESGTIDISDPDKMYVDSDAELDLTGISADGWTWKDASPADAETGGDDSASSGGDSATDESSSDTSAASSDGKTSSEENSS